jgi:glucose/arabinose dehydrogenase
MSHPRLERFARLFALAVYTVATFSFAGISHAGGPVLPSGYSLTPVATGLNLPTNLAWLPDGTQLLVEKAGFVRTIKNGVVSSTPMVDITATTNDYWDRGLLGVAVDPDYTNNHYLYLLHTYENNKSDYTGTKMNQLLRVTIDPATGIMVAGSTVVLLGTQTPATSCQDLPATADCIPSDSPSHSVGDVVFAPDGTLFVTSGDGSSFDYTDPLALRAQNLDNLNGKMLHIDRNGKGLSTNPFYTGNVGDNRSKVWAYGLRNPWRFAFKPGTSVPYIADVGYATWEEVNVAQAGRNFGWPCYEGAAKQPDYSSLSGCQTLYSQVAAGTATVTPPLTATNHNGQQSAITGGAWVTGTNYPAALQGTFVYGDYALGTMHTLRTDANHALTGAPTDFGNGLTGPVDFEQGPDGNLYVLQISDAAGNLGTGALYRLDYQDVGSGSCPTGQFNAQYFNGATPSGTPVISGCEATPLNHDWGQGSPGAGVNTDNWSAKYTGTFAFNAGDYTFNTSSDDGVRVLVDGATVVDGWKDQATTAYTTTRAMTAGDHTVEIDYYDSGWDANLTAGWQQVMRKAPTLTIKNPADAALVPIGSTVNFSGSAVDADGVAVPASGLTWNAVVKHCPNGQDCHNHFLQSFDGVASGSFVYPDHGIDPYHIELSLTATDAKGATATKTISLYPDRAATCAASSISVQYFNNKTLSGSPVATDCVTAINYDWGLGSPVAPVNADNFSARFTTTQTFAAGTYKFTLTGDDGIRLYIDGTLFLSGWKDQGTTTYTKNKILTTGNHTIKVEYYDSGYNAVAKASWVKL